MDNSKPQPASKGTWLAAQGFVFVSANHPYSPIGKPKGAKELSPGLNGTKLRGIWGILLSPEGLQDQPRVSTLGNFNLAVRPEAEGA